MELEKFSYFPLFESFYRKMIVEILFLQIAQILVVVFVVPNQRKALVQLP
jgi:hypothetical protein